MAQLVSAWTNQLKELPMLNKVPFPFAFKLANCNFQEKPIIASGLICKCLASLKSCHEITDQTFSCIIKENHVFVCIYFHGNVLFQKTYEDEHKQLNFEEHKEEFEMQSLTVMDLSRAET